MLIAAAATGRFSAEDADSSVTPAAAASASAGISTHIHLVAPFFRSSAQRTQPRSIAPPTIPAAAGSMLRISIGLWSPGNVCPLS